MYFIHGCCSDIGNFRPNNEDSILTYSFSKDNLEVCIGIVCDGIGGLANGEYASKRMTASIMDWVVNLSTSDLSSSDFKSITMNFKEQLHSINNLICKESALNSLQTGSTISGIIIVNNDYMIVNVGDSRVYYVKKEVIQLTTDDVQEKKSNGRIKNVLSQCIGYNNNIYVNTEIGKVKNKDSFLFCSDGFYKLMKKREIRNTVFWLGKKKNASLVCSRLIKRIKKRGERDNISVGIIKCVTSKADKIK